MKISYRYRSYLAGNDIDLAVARSFFDKMKLEGAVDNRGGPWENSEVIFAETEFGTVGMALFFRTADQCLLWLDLLFVVPDFRRKGIATALILKVVQQGKVRGLPVELGTFETNIQMRNLSEKLGFKTNAIIFRRVAE